MRVESADSPGSRHIPPSSRRPPKSEPEASDGLDRKQLLSVLTRLKKGDFSVRLAPGARGVEGRIADTFNDVVELNQRMSLELERLSPRGRQGRPDRQRAFARRRAAARGPRRSTRSTR